MQRIIRISEEVRISLERVDTQAAPAREPGGSGTAAPSPRADSGYEKLTSAKLAAKLGMTTKDFLEGMTDAGYLALKADRHYVSAMGKQAGCEWRPGAGGGYLLWPADITVPP